jgi:hypothetical protein
MDPVTSATTPLLNPAENAAGENEEQREIERPVKESGTVTADGYLKKKNRWGFWQKRFFELAGTELKYYSNEQKKNPRPPLRIVDAALNGRFGDFDVETETRDLELRAKHLNDAKLWVKKIEDALIEAERQEEGNKKPAPVKPKPIPPSLKNMEGYLEMPSGIRFKPWQDRYFRVTNTSLFYYHDNTRAKDDYEGEIVLVDPRVASKTVVELNDSANGKGFVVRTGEKDYKFRAPSADAAKDWVAALQAHVDNAPVVAPAQRDNSEEKADMPQPNKTPKWIEEWDAETDADHVLKIQRHLDSLFLNQAIRNLRKKL